MPPLKSLWAIHFFEFISKITCVHAGSLISRNGIPDSSRSIDVIEIVASWARVDDHGNGFSTATQVLSRELGLNRNK